MWVPGDILVLSQLTAEQLDELKTLLALANVDNTSDADKPVSTATQTALDAKLAKALIPGFGRLNLAAGLTNDKLFRPLPGLSGGIDLPVVMDRAGSILGISVAANAARSAGSATFEVWKNAVATGLTAVLNAATPQFTWATQAVDADTFVAGDRLDVRVTTTGDWAPTTTEVEAVITVGYP